MVPAKSIAALAALVLLARCGDLPAQSVEVIAGGTDPFNELGGVHLGMRMSELGAARAGARRLEDYLFGEDLGAFETSYIFPVPIGGYDEDPGLEAVQARRRFESESAAIQEWQGLVPTLRDRFGSPTECIRQETSGAWTEEMVWRGDGVDLIHGVTIASPPPPRESARLVWFRVARPKPPVESATSTRRAFPCPG